MAKKLYTVSLYVNQACDCSEGVVLNCADKSMEERNGSAVLVQLQDKESAVIKCVTVNDETWYVPFHAVNRVKVQAVDCEDEPAEDEFCKEKE